MYLLPETELMNLSVVKEDHRTGVYILEPLAPGYGITLGNSLRRVLFASLEGSAISAVRIDGVTHEFTTIPGMKEDVVQMILNLKTLRVQLLDDEPTTLRLDVKGAGEITAKDFTTNANVRIVEPDHYLCTLDKAGKLSLEVVVARGRGYVPTEQRKHEQHPLGTITVDSIFTPVKKVHYEVENTRVGGMTNFDKLTLDMTTDGTIHPRTALMQAAQILVDHFTILTQASEPPTKKPAKKLKRVSIEVSEEMAPVETAAVAVPSKSRKKAPTVKSESLKIASPKTPKKK